MRALALMTLLACAPGCDNAEASEVPPPPRLASEHRSDRLTGLLVAADRVIGTRGFAAEGQDLRGFLVDHASEVHDAPLRSGSCYVVAGVASSAVRELDLRLFDTDGAEVAQDSTTGARAALHYCPVQSGMYYLAARATAGTGLYAVRRFRGPSGIDVRIDDLFRDAPPEAAPEKRP